jgi:RecB family exonuclease
VTGLHLVVSDNPQALLEAAADPFLHPQGPAARAFSSPPCLLALRQGGLRDDLYGLAAERGIPGWFDPPLCVFSELPAWLGATSLRPLGDFERSALLTHLLRTAGGATFRGREAHFTAGVEQLFGELRAEAVSPETFAAAVDRLERRERFEEERDTDLVRLYTLYVKELDRLGCRDGRDALADTASAVRASPGTITGLLGGRREIRVLGLADLRGGWKLLLAALRDCPALDRVVVYSCTDLRLPEDLLDSRERLSSIPATAVPRGRVDWSIITEPDPGREMDAVASSVRALIDQGASPHRIAIVPRQARPNTDFILDSLARAGVPARVRRRIAWRQVPCVRAVFALLEAAGEGWTRHGLAELGAQPYFTSDIDIRVINFIGYRERVAGLESWGAALNRLLAEARAAQAAPDDEPARRARGLPVGWVEQAAERFGRFRAMAAEIEAERSLTAWLDWLAGWLQRDPWEMERRMMRVPDDRWDVVRLDLLAWAGLRTVLRDWLAAERQWPGDEAPLPVTAFLQRLRSMLDGDVALWTGPARGVQVVEALATSHRVFDHVFLVGMNAGQFPRRAPSSLLLGEEDREALHAAGLPLDTTADWDAREADLFRVLVAGAKQTLTLSYSTLDETGADANPSSFVEALRSAGEPSLVEARPVPFPGMPALAAHAERAAAIERLRATGRLSPWNGAIEDRGLRDWLAREFGDDHVWSPTRIEEYAKCPWAWFSARLLRLELYEDPDGDIDPRARGSVLHDALRRFYEAAAARGGGPVFLEPPDAEWARPLLRESLAEAMGAAPTGFWLGHPALREVKRGELEQMLLAFLDFEIEENRKSRDRRTTAGKMVRTAVAEHEVAFDEVSLERDGVRFGYRGIMDRVEVGVDDRAPGAWVAAIDYKTTVYACPGAGKPPAWDDGVVLQIPLYAWALGILRPEATVSRVEYRAIKQATRAHALSLVRLEKDGVSDHDADQARMEGALSAVARHVRRIRDGEFPASPAPSCNCPPFCHGWDVCRVKGGPSTGRD